MDKDQLFERLVGYGIDVRGVNDRFMGDNDLYQRCFSGFLEEPNFELLKQRIENKDYAAAFQSAHAIKGLSGNLGLSPFYKAICTLVESLRAKDYRNIAEEYALVASEFEILKALEEGKPPPLPVAETPENPSVKAESPVKKHIDHTSFIESKRFLPAVAAFTCFGILLVISLFSGLITAYSDNTDTESAGHLSEISRQITLYIEKSIDSDWRSAYSVANTITKSDGSYKSISTLIKDECRIWNVSNVVVYTEDGGSISANGVVQSNDAASHTVYLTKKNGELMSIVKSSLTYTVPLDTEFEINGSKIVAVSLEQDLSSFLSEMDFSTFEEQASLYLTQSNGTIVSYLSNNGAGAAYNFMALLEGREIEPLDDTKDFSADSLLSANTMGSYIMSSPSGRVFMISSPVSTKHESLHLFYLVPEKAVNGTMNQFSSYVINLCASIVAIFSAAIILVFLFVYYNRKKQFDKAITGRERMFDLLSQNTSSAFALMSTEREEPIYVSSNVRSVIGYPYLSIRRTDEGRYYLVTFEGASPGVLAQVNEKLANWDGKGEYISDYLPATMNGVTRYYNLYIYQVEQSETDFVGIAQDVTKAYEREEAVKNALAMAERSNAAKDNFLSNMSHDFRTPLNAIINMTDFAISNISSPAKQLENLRIVKQSSEILLGLINKVLDMSRIESGQVKLDDAPFDIAETLERVCDIVRPLCAEKKQTFIVDFKRVKASNILGDQLKLSQVLINLLSNAVKFTPINGAIRFTAENIPSFQKDIADMRFTIEDNGIGISESDLERIFDPFMRADDERVHHLEGTGLGLPICKSYVTAMGGSISCTSEPENGSVFTVDLFFPLAKKLDVAPAHAPAFDQAPFAGLRCLLCEDNATNMLIGKSLLEKTGFIVDTAEDGRIGSQKFILSKPNFYDIVYMDIQMPNMDGYQASVAIRESEHPQAKSIPIVALSANVFPEDMEKARLAGMNGYVGKPIIVLDLIDETNKALKSEGY